MNVKRGLGRLAILLGIGGAILGAFFGYARLQPELSQRAQHNRFEQLAASDVVRKTRPTWDSLQAPESPNDPWGVTSVTAKVDKDGIKTISWGEDGSVESIETSDGQTLYPTPAPNRWAYLLVALSPIFGFLIPWGGVRAVYWTLNGFADH